MNKFGYQEQGLAVSMDRATRTSWLQKGRPEDCIYKSKSLTEFLQKWIQGLNL